jgi:uncharacterized membrane protein
MQLKRHVAAVVAIVTGLTFVLAPAAPAAPPQACGTVEFAPLIGVTNINNAGVLAGRSENRYRAKTYDSSTDTSIWLGGVEAGLPSAALFISDSNLAVGQAQVGNSGGPFVTFRGRQGSLPLKAMPRSPDAEQSSVPVAANSADQVAVTENVRVGDQLVARAGIWSHADSPPEPMPLPSGVTGSFAVDINEEGTLMALALVERSDPDTVQRMPILWTPGQAPSIVWPNPDMAGFLPVNLSDTGVIYGVTDEYEPRLMRWHADEGFTELAVPAESAYVWPYAANNHGSVVGFWQAGESGGELFNRAFLFDPASGFLDLGLPDHNGGYSIATGINDNGQVTGMLNDNRGLGEQTFVWSPCVM